MTELGDSFRDDRAARQNRRAKNRQASAIILRDKGVPFTAHNNGAHLVVEGANCYIDFWPGTGKWAEREGPKRKGFGVRGLLDYIIAKK